MQYFSHLSRYFENVGGIHFDAAFAALRPYGRVAVCGTISCEYLLSSCGTFFAGHLIIHRIVLGAAYNDENPAPSAVNLRGKQGSEERQIRVRFLACNPALPLTSVNIHTLTPHPTGSDDLHVPAYRRVCVHSVDSWPQAARVHQEYDRVDARGRRRIGGPRSSGLGGQFCGL